MLNTDTRTRQDGLAIELAIDTIQLLARRILGAELQVLHDARGRPRRLRGFVVAQNAPEVVEFAVAMNRHGFIVVFDPTHDRLSDRARRTPSSGDPSSHAPDRDVVIVVDPWACQSSATPERRLDLAARLSEQHGAAEAELAIVECEREEAKCSGSASSRCSHAMCDVPRRREDAMSGGYVNGLGQTCAYLEYLTSTSNPLSSGDAVDHGAPVATSPAPPSGSTAARTRYRASTAYGSKDADTLELAVAHVAWLIDRPMQNVRMLEVTPSRWHLTDRDGVRVGTIEIIST
jgi:hypothetical protein